MLNRNEQIENVPPSNLGSSSSATLAPSGSFDLDISVSNLTLKFKQPSDSEPEDNRLSVELRDLAGGRMGTIKLECENREALVEIIDNVAYLEHSHNAGSIIDVEELAQALSPIQFDNIVVSGEFGTSLASIIRNYGERLDPTPTPVSPEKPRQYHRNIDPDGSLSIWTFENANEDIKQRIRKSLGIDKIECTSIGKSSSPHTLVEAYDDHIIMKVFELNDNNENETGYDVKAINIIATPNHFVLWQEGSSQFTSEFPKKLPMTLAAFSEPNIGTVIYSFLQDLLKYNYSAIDDLRTDAHTLRTNMLEPLDSHEVHTVVPKMEDAAFCFDQLVTSQEALPAHINAFLSHNDLKRPTNAELIFSSLRSQTANEINNELLKEVNGIHTKHSALSEVRNGSIGKKIGLISAITLPQIVASAFVGPTLALTTANVVTHGIGLAISAALIYVAHKKRWMWP